MSDAVDDDGAFVRRTFVNRGGFRRVGRELCVLRIGEEKGVGIVAISAVVIENPSDPAGACRGQIESQAVSTGGAPARCQNPYLMNRPAVSA